MSDTFTYRFHPAFSINGFPINQENPDKGLEMLLNSGEEHLRKAVDFLIIWMNDSSKIRLQTSGSTGAPKQIVVKKNSMIHSAQATHEYFELPYNCKSLLCLPMDYIAGKMMLVRALVNGWNLWIVPPVGRIRLEANEIFDFCAMTPYQIANSMDIVEQIKCIIVGGAPVSLELYEKLRACRNSIHETYGMTETVSHIAARRISASKFKHDENPFCALPSVQLSLDSRACLTILASYISEDPLVTNDIVDLEEDARSFFWRGRFDNIINSGGVKLFPERIERLLAPTITDNYFVFGIENTQFGEVCALLVEAKREDKSILSRIIKTANLSSFELPKKIFFLDQFCYTPNGKLDRRGTINLLEQNAQ